MGDSIRLSVTISGLSRLFPDGLSGVIEAARVADDAGIDGIAVPDHLAIGPRTDRYPYGTFPFERNEPWLEPLTLLAAMAGVTRRVRLATSILIAPLRSALLLAKSLASLDVLSEGRVDLGVGTGWQPEEFEGAGVPFRGRGERMDDTLRACRALWSQAPASFESKTVRFESLWCLPQPVQAGGIPIWIGGALNARNRARLVEYGAGWMPLVGLDEVRAGVAQLREALRGAGRDPRGLGVRANVPVGRDADGRVDLDRTLDGLPALREAGVTDAAFALARFARNADEVRPFLERLGRAGRA